ncbi:SCO family protein [Anaerolineae bacterium CFX9]|nr:SCO family protein [Anaerolineae bacterium CFX9]
MTESPSPAPAPVNKSGRAFWLGMLLIGILLTSIVLLINLRNAVLTQANATPTLAPDANGIFSLSEAREVADFTMTANSGSSVSLSELTDGRYTLMFFGYTHCPDFCPLTLSKFRQIKRELGEQGELLNYVFVSVDGQRDTPVVLDSYVRRFDERFIGLTGTEVTLQQIAPDYGLFYQLNNQESQVDYLVDHSTSTYLIDPQRRLRVIYTYGAEIADMVESLRVILAQDGVSQG